MILGALLCATSGGLMAAATSSQLTEHSTQHLTMHFSGSGDHTLEIRTIEGNITVQAYDGPDVQMIVDKTLSAENEDEMRAARREVVLDMGNDAATLHAIVRYPNQQTCGGRNGYTSRPGYHARFDFTIRVPRAAQLQLCTIDNGVVLVSGMTGDFAISNVNGRISMTDVAGSGTAVTVNGAVAAEYVSAPRHSSTFRTTNGDVAVTLPQRPSSALHLRTLNGHVINEFATTPDAAGPVASTVSLGADRAGLTLETLNGDVRVLRRSR